MAYQASYLTEEQKNKQNATGGIATSGVTDAYTGTGGTSGSGAAPAANPAADQKTPGTGFVNLQQYLDQNAGEGARLAGDATKGVVDQANAFKGTTNSTVDTAKKDFTAAAKTDVADSLASGIKNDASAVKSTAVDFLGKGYEGKAAGDYTAGLAATKDSLSASLGKVDDAGVLTESLAGAYGKKGTYTPGFGDLDRFLVGGTESGRNKLAEVKGKASDVNAAYGSAASKLASAEQAAKAQLEANKKKVQTAAVETRKNILTPAQKALEAQNAALDTGRAGAVKASLGDVIKSRDTRLDLDALSELLKSQGGDWWKETFEGGRDAEPAVAIQQGKGKTSKGGSNALPGAAGMGAVLKAGGDIAAGVKKTTDPYHESHQVFKDFLKTPNAGNLGNVVASITKAPIKSAAAGVQIAKGVTNGVNKASGKAADKAIPNLGKIINPIQLPPSPPPVKLAVPKFKKPKLAVPKFKKPKW